MVGRVDEDTTPEELAEDVKLIVEWYAIGRLDIISQLPEQPEDEPYWKDATILQKLTETITAAISERRKK